MRWYLACVRNEHPISTNKNDVKVATVQPGVKKK